MPQAKPPTPPKSPAALSDAEVSLIKAAVERIFGEGAVVRNWGANPAELRLHVEATDVQGPRVSELLGLLYARIDRDRIGVSFTKRGSRVSGDDKIAYRQGVVL
jgi:integrase